MQPRDFREMCGDLLRAYRHCKYIIIGYQNVSRTSSPSVFSIFYMEYFINTPKSNNYLRDIARQILISWFEIDFFLSENVETFMSSD